MNGERGANHGTRPIQLWSWGNITYSKFARIIPLGPSGGLSSSNRCLLQTHDSTVSGLDTNPDVDSPYPLQSPSTVISLMRRVMYTHADPCAHRSGSLFQGLELQIPITAVAPPSI